MAYISLATIYYISTTTGRETVAAPGDLIDDMPSDAVVRSDAFLRPAKDEEVVLNAIARGAQLSLGEPELALTGGGKTLTLGAETDRAAAEKAASDAAKTPRGGAKAKSASNDSDDI